MGLVVSPSNDLASPPNTLVSGPRRPEPAPDAQAVMSQAGSENFTVASLLLPPWARSSLLAIYGFARLVDDAGDEAPGDRLALLDELESDLERLWARGSANGGPRHPLIARLKPAVDACGLPQDPFRRLIEANRRDQHLHRYHSYEELLDYCTLSANPVGELVLRVFGALTPERLALSDKVCTALQLTEHWQDVGEDYRRGRIYLPAEDLDRFDVGDGNLATRSVTPPLRALMSYEVTRARHLLDEGAPLIRTLRGRSRLAVAGFVAGGRAALAAIEAADYEVLASSPRAGTARRAVYLLRALGPGAGR